MASTLESMDMDNNPKRVVMYSDFEDSTFWWVVEWLLHQDVKQVNDKLIFQFLQDVEEEDYPAHILARFFLRQIKKWSSDMTRKIRSYITGASMQPEIDFKVPNVLLNHLHKLSSSSSEDDHYPRGKLSRMGLKVPSKLITKLQALRGATGEEYNLKDSAMTVLDDLSKYVSRADDAMGPCYLKQLESRLHGSSQNRKSGTAPSSSPPNTAAEMEECFESDVDADDLNFLDEEQEQKEEEEEEEAAPTRKRKVRRVVVNESEDEAEDDEESEGGWQEVKPRRANKTKQGKRDRNNDFVDTDGNAIRLTTNISIGDQETRDTIEELKKSSKNLRAIGTDPLQDALAQAKQAKKQSTTNAKKNKLIQKQAGGKVSKWDGSEEEEDEIEASGKGEAGGEEAPATMGIGGRVQRAALQERTNLKNSNNGKKRKEPGRRKVDMETGRRANTYWSEEEASRLVDGVMKFGKGKWKVILAWGKSEDFFLDRNAVDLKDKFRNLEKYAQAAE
jgi:hypothetical protein